MPNCQTLFNVQNECENDVLHITYALRFFFHRWVFTHHRCGVIGLSGGLVNEFDRTLHPQGHPLLLSNIGTCILFGQNQATVVQNNTEHRAGRAGIAKRQRCLVSGSVVSSRSPIIVCTNTWRGPYAACVRREHISHTPHHQPECPM